MRTNLVATVLVALLSVPALAGDVEVKISFPWLTAPPLVVVAPGIQVVPDYDEEVFFVDGWYWTRRGGRWYHARDHHMGWVLAPGAVPVGLTRLPPGKYRRWKAARTAVKREVKAEKAFVKQVIKKSGGPGKGRKK